jgi:hypothetical protein
MNYKSLRRSFVKSSVLTGPSLTSTVPSLNRLDDFAGSEVPENGLVFLFQSDSVSDGKLRPTTGFGTVFTRRFLRMN